MDSAILTATVGVLGSLVGSSSAVATAWVTQRNQTRRELTQAEIRKRESLYGEFIGECAKLLLDAFTHKLEKPEVVLPLYALINRVRLCATPPVLAQAEELLARITDQYESSNLTLAQMRTLARSGDDPLKPFGEACRVELKAMRSRI
jgi:hypothetical protein